MEPHQVAQRLEEFESLCRMSGTPITVQRRVVLRAVLERDDHPTADQVFDVARDRVPGISRTTVYRVLDKLTELGLIRRLHHPGASVRFDGTIGRHHHLVCQKCGKVTDFTSAKLDKLPLPEVNRQQFEIQDFSVHCFGTCARCRKRRKRRRK